MGSEKSKPRQPFTEFLELHVKVTNKVMEENIMNQSTYTEFLISEISKFFNTKHPYFKQGMYKYVKNNSKSIYRCYRQFLRQNCMTENWSSSHIDPSSLEQEFYKYVIEFYQCSLQFSITKEDYLAIIDDVLSFMNFLKSIKKSVIKPKIWNKEIKDSQIQPISHSVQKLLFDIGKKVYAEELTNIKNWMLINISEQSNPQVLSQQNRNSVKYLRNFEKRDSSYSRKHGCLVKYFQTIDVSCDEEEVLKHNLKNASSENVFIQLLILSRLGSKQADKLINILEKEIPLNLKINSQ